MPLSLTCISSPGSQTFLIMKSLAFSTNITVNQFPQYHMHKGYKLMSRSRLCRKSVERKQMLNVTFTLTSHSSNGNLSTTQYESCSKKREESPVSLIYLSYGRLMSVSVALKKNQTKQTKLKHPKERKSERRKRSSFPQNPFPVQR